MSDTAHDSDLHSGPQVISAAAFAGERKVVTVMFADISGFTALSERLDAEVVRDLMNDCFDHLVPVIEQYGGFVDKFIGDAIMALFGAPMALENAPERALRAALALLDAVQEFNHYHGTNLGIHMGINTGLVIAGGIGSAGRQQYSVLGDAVNLAARLEDASVVGEVLVGPDTQRAAAPLFELTALEPMPIKGKTLPVQVYRLEGLRAQPGRVRGIDGLESPLVGRGSEMALMSRALDQLLNGQGHILGLVGDAGLGKSRLISELRAEHHARVGSQSPMYWLDVSAVSYRAAQPYSLFQEIVRRIARIKETDTPAQIHAQVEALLEKISANDETFPAYAPLVLETLLGLSPDKRLTHLEGENFKRELFEVMTAMARDWAATGPVVLALDDLHWSDPASIELLNHLITLPEWAAVLVICAFRPDRDSPVLRLEEALQANPARATQLQIRPLSRSDSNSMIDFLLAIAELPVQLRSLILDKAEGNPFFVEEVVRELIVQEVVTRDPDGLRWRAVADVESITIPESLQSLLTTRIDRLDEAARNILQIAAVVGRNFPLSVLQRVVDDPADLETYLETLVQADLVALSSRRPEREYFFRHALTQEAAYNSILVRRRRAYHQRVGETLISLYPDQVDELASALAHHFSEAGDDVRAISFATRAGDNAFRLFAVAEATTHYRCALERAKRQPDSAAMSELLAHLGTRLGRSLELNSKYSEACELYRELLNLAQQRSDITLELPMLLAEATIRAAPSSVRDSAEAIDLASQALALARGLGDGAAESKALWCLQLAKNYSGEIEQAMRYGEQSLEIARKLGLREQMAYTLNDLTFVYLAIRGPLAAQEVATESNRLWRELRNLPMLADSLGNISILAYIRGDFDASYKAADEGLRVSRVIGNLWGQAMNLGRRAYAALEHGEYEKALNDLEESRRLGEQTSMPFAQTATLAELGWLWALLGDPAKGMEFVRLSLSRLHVISRQFQSWPLTIAARVQLLIGDLIGARQSIARCLAMLEEEQTIPFTSLLLPIARFELDFAEGNYESVIEATNQVLIERSALGVHQFLPDILLTRGEAFAALGRLDEAHEALVQGLTLAASLGSERTSWQLALSLGRAEQARGRSEAAAGYFALAREGVEIISERISDLAIRETFLAQENVRQALQFNPSMANAT